MRTTTYIIFANGYRTGEGILPKVEYVESCGYKINIITISDVYDTSSFITYLDTLYKAYSEFGNVKMKYIMISNKNIDNVNYKHPIIRLFKYLKNTINGTTLDDIIISSNNGGKEMITALKCMFVWFKYLYPGMKVSFDGIRMNIPQEIINDTMSHYNEKSLIEKLLQITTNNVIS